MSQCIIKPNGTKEWNRGGQLHRLDGPAVEYPNGCVEWWLDGRLHREDGPAKEWPDSSKEWYQHGELHRIDGPAVEYNDGTKCWYTHNNRLDPESAISNPYLKQNFPELVTSMIVYLVHRS